MPSIEVVRVLVTHTFELTEHRTSFSVLGGMYFPQVRCMIPPHTDDPNARQASFAAFKSVYEVPVGSNPVDEVEQDIDAMTRQPTVGDSVGSLVVGIRVGAGVTTGPAHASDTPIKKAPQYAK